MTRWTLSARAQGDQTGGQGRGRAGGDLTGVGGEPELGAARAGAGVEGAVGALAAGGRLEEVVRAVGVGRLVELLGVVAGPAEVAIEQAGGEALAPDRLDGRPADHQLA